MDARQRVLIVMTTFSGVAHVAVVVRDMQTSVDWYRRMLGFEPQGR